LDDLGKEQLEGEMKELQELLEDLSLKIEELKTSPDVADGPAPEIVARELDRDLNAAAGSNYALKQVNDLTAVVKKKRKAPEQEPTAASASATSTPPEKKAKVESST